MVFAVCGAALKIAVALARFVVGLATYGILSVLLMAFFLGVGTIAKSIFDNGYTRHFYIGGSTDGGQYYYDPGSAKIEKDGLIWVMVAFVPRAPGYFDGYGDELLAQAPYSKEHDLLIDLAGRRYATHMEAIFDQDHRFLLLLSEGVGDWVSVDKADDGLRDVITDVCWLFNVEMFPRN